MIQQLEPSDAPRIVDVLCEAFYDYPVMHFVLGESADYDERLHALIGFFVAARALPADPMFGIGDGTRLLGVMTTSNPAKEPHPDLAAVEASLFERLGPAAQARLDVCVHAWKSIAYDAPQLHVNMIGVRNDQRGRGLARVMFDAVHSLCENTPDAAGVSLTTELPRNVELYSHLGYEVTGETTIAPGLQTWNMFRRR